jgi:hypothetical protein
MNRLEHCVSRAFSPILTGESAKDLCEYQMAKYQMAEYQMAEYQMAEYQMA